MVMSGPIKLFIESVYLRIMLERFLFSVLFVYLVFLLEEACDPHMELATSILYILGALQLPQYECSLLESIIGLFV